MHTGPIYEPRAFWGVGLLTPTLVGAPVRLTLNREFFRNGTRWPVTLDRMLLAPVGYTFNDYPGTNTPPVALGDVDAAASVLEKMKVSVTAPDRFQFDHGPNAAAGFTEEQVHDTSMRRSPTRPYSSGLFNVCRWDFPEDRAMIIPRGGMATFGLGAVLLQPTGLDAGVVDNPEATIAFTESYGKGGGDGITKQVPLRWSALTPTPAGPFFPADGLGFNGGQTAQLWPPESNLTAKDWRQQQQTQAGSTRVSGFSVAIDQQAYETAIQALPAPRPTQPIASLALRTPCRARMTDGGSKADWWRPGAPLALVSPSMTPAKVFRLMRPIVLNPGDVLEVELEAPGGYLFDPSDDPIFPTFQMGVSFTGFATIEG